MSQRITNQVIIDEVITRKVATIMLSHPDSAIVDVARKLNVSRELVKRILESDKFREVLQITGDEAMAGAVASTRKAMVGLAVAAVEVIKFQLSQNNLEAAKVVLKTIGLEQQDQRPSDTTLTVILPGQGEISQTINAEYEIKKDG